MLATVVRRIARRVRTLGAAPGAVASRREELEALVEGREEQPVLLHPNMAEHYRAQVADLAVALNEEEHRAEAVDILRSLIDRIELTPDEDDRLEMDLYGALAGILSMAAGRQRPLDESGPGVLQVKVVAGVGFGFDRTSGSPLAPPRFRLV